MLRTASSLPLHRACAAGLRPGPVPDRAASLLPGLLAATRTGLPPAGDDELTNTKKHHGSTSRCHLPLCWAHESPRLVSPAGDSGISRSHIRRSVVGMGSSAVRGQTTARTGPEIAGRERVPRSAAALRGHA